MKFVVAIIAALFVLIAVYVVVQVRSTINGMWEYEYALHSMLVMGQVVGDFVIENDRFPQDWMELSSIKHEAGVVSWPKDEQIIRSHVDIEFGHTLEEIADSGRSLVLVHCELMSEPFNESINAELYDRIRAHLMVKETTLPADGRGNELRSEVQRGATK